LANANAAELGHAAALAVSVQVSAAGAAETNARPFEPQSKVTFDDFVNFER